MGSAMVGNRVTSDHQQPGQRLARNVGQAPPRDQERFGDDLLCDIPVDMAQCVRHDVRSVLPPYLRELLLWIWAHIEKCPPTARALPLVFISSVAVWGTTC